jgi:hypothetical protein
MADDQFQRPYRASEPPVRGSAKTSGSDPLAELARLIGQTDPFGEFARRSQPSQPAERSDWNAEPFGTSYPGQTRADPRDAQRLSGNGYYGAPATSGEQAGAPYSDQNYGREAYGSTSAAEDPYQTEQEARGYPSSEAGYQRDAYGHDAPQFAEEDYYDDMPSSRRRIGVIAIAGVLVLAVIGTAGAFGYRAIFGSSGSTQPPPVIKADTGPSKIVPSTTGKDAQSNKLITDRVNERGQSEKLVSREEQPIDKATTVVVTQPGPQSALGSGVVASEPKKVRTIAIHPDQPAMADAPMPAAVSPAAPTAPARTATPVASAKPAAPPVRSVETADAEQGPPPTPPAARSAPVRQAAPASSSAPLSLRPDASSAQAAPKAAAAPTRTASVPPPAPAAPSASSNSGAPGSFVQVSSQRSEAEAQAAFRTLQAKYPNQLGGRQPLIHKVDLGAKGTYYRAMVGPFANSTDAGELCSSLKAAGGQCLIQRN